VVRRAASPASRRSRSRERDGDARRLSDRWRARLKTKTKRLTLIVRTLAQALKAHAEKEYELAVAEAVARGEAPEEKDGADGADKPADGSETVLPVARVKRIIKLDKDVKQASADAIKCITKACELFLEGLAVGSHAGMRAAKRKGVQYKDLETFVLRRGKYEFLHDHVWAMRPKDTDKGGDGDDDDDDDQPSAKKAKQVTDAKGSHRLTEFFKPASAGNQPAVIPETQVAADEEAEAE
jgi:histone H3/H4